MKHSPQVRTDSAFSFFGFKVPVRDHGCTVEAKRRFTVEDHIRATEGVECRKDAEVIDETPMAYKDIDAVIAAQTDLIEVVHTLRQVVCVKG